MALLCKSGSAFWKSWKAKFKTTNIIQVGGTVDNATTAVNFAKHFESICIDNSFLLLWTAVWYSKCLYMQSHVCM